MGKLVLVEITVAARMGCLEEFQGDEATVLGVSDTFLSKLT